MTSVEVLLNLSKYLAIPILFSYLVWETYLKSKNKVSSIFLMLVLFSVFFGCLIGTSILNRNVFNYPLFEISDPRDVVQTPEFIWQWNVVFLLATIIVAVISFNTKSKKPELKGLVQLFLIIFGFLFLFLLFLVMRIVAIFFTVYFKYKITSLIVLMTFFSVFLLFSWFIIYFMFKRSVDTTSNELAILKKGWMSTSIMIFFVILFLVYNMAYFPNIESEDIFENYVILNIYSSDEHYSKIKTVYHIERFGMLSWVPLEFNYDLIRSNAISQFTIHLNASGGTKMLLNAYRPNTKDYVPAHKNISYIHIPETMNVAYLGYNREVLEKINATGFIIEGYRKDDFSRNISFDDTTQCSTTDIENVSLCKTFVQISNKLGKEVIIQDTFLINYQAFGGYNPEKCSLGNLSGVYSGKSEVKFRVDCHGDNSCETRYNQSLFVVDLYYNRPALMFDWIKFTEAADLNMTIESNCAK